jgi:CRP-like cAMP-binding protein
LHILRDFCSSTTTAKNSFIFNSTLKSAAFFATQQPKSSDSALMTRQELADLTGTTVQKAIRVTRSFEKSGILDLSNA